MDNTQLIGLLARDSIPSWVVVSHRKEVNNIIKDCERKVRYFKKQGLLPKDKTKEYLSASVLKIKGLQRQGEVALSKDNPMEGVIMQDFLRSTKMEYKMEDNKVVIGQDDREKLGKFFRKVDKDMEQLELFGAKTGEKECR